ncbi:hypothetical protein [Halanaerobacter jeridensis]|uniref:Uncharacterized protein n=1 Tax=Halanaerobacter jeridensis TaxID=706427 RepID=A0A939BNH2_9FIRM|nr:hypothetical protein [Halanaerobacter jeridensis]MBM7555487.1 hypothetical protein [Halanaerobacter jeridensis]
MVINDFIKPRQEIITSDYQFNLNFADINSVDRLESSPEDFCAKTYPSQSLNRLIQIINDKIIGSSDLGSVVLTGAQGAGKTHALLMAYNLFANPDAIKNWLIEHKIKFNKFNLAIIKNQSKYCTVKAKDLADKNLWEVIFNKLGAQDLLKRVKEYPERKIIKKLINREYTAVVIDELEAYFSQLKENNNDLVESSKEFLKNLLDVAAENNNLFVFSSIKGEEYELLELVESSNAQLLNLSEFEEESEIINYRLFSSINKNVHRNEINKIIEEYINIYQEQKINIVRKEELAETLISTYPFHCDLMKLLKQQSQTQKLFILADIIGKYYDQQELLLVENIELDSLSSLNSEIYSSVQEIKKNLGEHNWDYFDEILTVLAAYNILQEHPVEKREILRGVITLANDNIDEIEKTLNHIVDESNNVIFTASGYKIKAKHDAVADWRSEIKKISQKSAKEELAAYIKENFFTTQYKVFGVDKIIDKQELTPILLLDHIAKENLSSFLENELYDSRKYENTIAVIIPKKNIITDDNLKDIKKLIAGQKLNLENSELKKIENGAEVAEEIKAANNRLQQDLKSSFGYYLDWKEEKGDYRLIKKEFNSEDFDIEVVAANNKKIKEYILKQAKKSKSGLEIEKLLHQLQVVRSNPVIASKEQFLAIVDELTAQGELIADNSTARLYKSKEELISFRADEIEDQQAAEEMVNYLKEEILPSYYKVYGWDELSDTEELEYVIFIDLPDKKEAKKDVINQLEADLKFDNTLVRIAANTNLLETEIMMTVKKILVAQSLTEEDFSELLATKKEKLITTLKSQFGSYLTWENKRNPDLNIKEISDISEIEDLVQTEKQALGNYILELLEAKKVIDIDELLVELKIDKSKVFIADDNDYYQLLRTLEERKELFLIEENNKIYIDSSKLLEGYTSSLSETELKEEFVKYVREKFFNDDYKIYGYDKIEDKPLIQSVLLFATPKETNKLETFIEDKLLCDFEYQNILLLLSPKKNIFKNDSFEYFRDLLAFTNLKSKVKKGKIERLIKDKEKKLMEKLNALQWEYIHWGQDGNRISLERQEVELKDLTSTIKVNKEQIKKYILKRVNEENKIASKKILLEMKKDKSNPFVYSNQLFNNLLEELRDNKKLFATTGIDIIYKDFITYIKDISKEFDKDKMKEKMIKYIKDNLFDFKF